jgi:lipopolysaccharide transport system ATP-binding protein
MSEPAIRVRGLGKRYQLWTGERPTTLSDRVLRVTDALRHRTHEEHHPARREIWALRGVDFDVQPGEVLGVIGPNGAGKSTLLSILARITEPTEGLAEINGRVNALLEVGTGFHPELSGRDNVFLNGAILGMSRAETAQKFDQIVEFAGVADFIDVPVKRYSSGMYVRLAFAVAVHLDPEVLLLDEVLAVGDRAFQEKCLARIQEMTEAGRAVLFVSHDPTSVMRLCSRAIVINEGRIVFEGDPQGAVQRYLTSRTLDGGGASTPAERPGTGEVRVAKVVVEGDGGPITPHSAFSIRVELDAPRPFDARHASLDLRIYGDDGVAYVALPTVLEGVMQGTVVLHCAVEDFPLRSGSYVVTTYIVASGELVDHVARAADFSVVPTDLAPSDHAEGGTFVAPVVVRHTWSVRDSVTTGVGAKEPV